MAATRWYRLSLTLTATHHDLVITRTVFRVIASFVLIARQVAGSAFSAGIGK
jgi:hypothetical protein